MNILVAGASGFIGKNLLLRIPEKWTVYGIYRSSKTFQSFLARNKVSNVVPLKCDLENIENVKDVMPKLEDIDTCVYLAANTNVRGLVKDPVLDVTTNIGPLLKFMKYFRGRKIVYFSSGAVYMGLKGKVSPLSRINPTIPYAISKYTCEQYIKFYKNTKKTFQQYVILRFFGAYGPHEPPRKISTKLLELIRDPEKNEFTVYGDGTNYIDFMYVDDAIRGILAVIQSPKANVTVDFCSGNPQTINELVTNVGRMFNRKIKITHLGTSPEYITFYASPQKMFRVFGFKPGISLKDGFRRFLNWFDNATSA